MSDDIPHWPRTTGRHPNWPSTPGHDWTYNEAIRRQMQIDLDARLAEENRLRSERRARERRLLEETGRRQWEEEPQYPHGYGTGLWPIGDEFRRPFESMQEWEARQARLRAEFLLRQQTEEVRRNAEESARRKEEIRRMRELQEGPRQAPRQDPPIFF